METEVAPEPKSFLPRSAFEDLGLGSGRNTVQRPGGLTREVAVTKLGGHAPTGYVAVVLSTAACAQATGRRPSLTQNPRTRRNALETPQIGCPLDTPAWRGAAAT